MLSQDAAALEDLFHLAPTPKRRASTIGLWYRRDQPRGRRPAPNGNARRADPNAVGRQLQVKPRAMALESTMAPAPAVGPSVSSVASATNRVASRSRKANAAAKPTPDCARPNVIRAQHYRRFISEDQAGGRRSRVAEGAYFPRECGQSIPTD